jgi:DNA-binding transcriptional regulator LsrR (DeoR family)
VVTSGGQHGALGFVESHVMARRELPEGAIEKAAYLASIGEPPKDIASMLRISTATAYRLVQQAKEKCLLQEIAPVLLLDDPQIRKIEHELFGRDRLLNELSTISEGVLTEIMVFNSRNNNRFPEIPAAVATYTLDRVLRATKHVGVTWGANICGLVNAIELMLSKRKPSRQYTHNIAFVQVCGELQQLKSPSVRSSILVSKLNYLLSESDTQYTFAMSASIPKRLNEQLGVVREFIKEVGDYAKIFAIENGQQRLHLHLDILLTSCGNGKSKQDRWISESAKEAGISDSELEELTVGNIAGYWLPRDDLDLVKSAQLDEINSRWIGVTLTDIADIARRGGVVLVATEDHKAQIILHLVRKKLISRLIISEELERSISHSLSQTHKL